MDILRTGLAKGITAPSEELEPEEGLKLEKVLHTVKEADFKKKFDLFIGALFFDLG